MEKRGLGVRRDRTAQPLMFLQNYLVDKCSIINLNPLAKRIHKYLNNGLFRVLPVYQTCHMSTFYICRTAAKKRAELHLREGFSIWVFYPCFQSEKCFTKWKLISKTCWYVLVVAEDVPSTTMCPLSHEVASGQRGLRVLALQPGMAR